MLTVVLHPFPIVKEAIVLAARNEGLDAVGCCSVGQAIACLSADTDFVVLAEISKTTGITSWTSLSALRALPGWQGGVVSAALRRPQHLPPFVLPPRDVVFAPWGHVGSVQQIVDGIARHASGATLREAWGGMKMARRRDRVRVDQATGEFIATMCTGDEIVRDASAYRRAADRLSGLAREVAALHPLRDCGVQAAVDLWWEGQLEW